MYKVLPERGGWSVYWLASPDAEPVFVPRPTDDPEERDRPYPQRQAAYRRAKKLNDLLKADEQKAAQSEAAQSNL
jgi:hypothetical protein